VSMYLPNPDLNPTGAEGSEFIDEPLVPERPFDGTAGLDVQTRLNITRWAREYISGLVDDNNGTRDDVRTIIRALHDQLVTDQTLTAPPESGF
jgi:hypothetical protein